MRRREFIAALMVASAARQDVAQQPAKAKRVALVGTAVKVADMRADGHPFYRVLFDQLKRVGYVEGQNLVVTRYSPEGARERVAEIAREVVSNRPDVIFTSGEPQVLALKAVTTEIPIVAIVGDPVASGILSSLARPGGNITGYPRMRGASSRGRRVSSFLKSSCQSCPS